MEKSRNLKKGGKNGVTGKGHKNGTGTKVSDAKSVKRIKNSVKKRPTIKANGKLKTAKDDLTKNFLENAANKSMNEAAEETMRVMGYNIVAKKGWLVKVFPDKKVEKITPIPPVIEKR